VQGRFFFDTSAFLTVIRREPMRYEVTALVNALKRVQLVTSVLVASVPHGA